MSIKVMSQVWEHSRQEGGALLVLLALADFADDRGDCYPSVGALATKSRLSERQVQRIITDLEAGGELQIQRGEGVQGREKRGSRTHRYHVVTGAKKGDIEAQKGDAVSPVRVTFATEKGDICDRKRVTPMSPEPSGNRQGTVTGDSIVTVQGATTEDFSSGADTSPENDFPPAPISEFDAVTTTPTAKLQQTDAEAHRLYEAFRAVKCPREMPGTWSKAEWRDALPTLREWVAEGRSVADVGRATHTAVALGWVTVTPQSVAKRFTDLLANAKPVRTAPPPPAVVFTDTFVPPTPEELAEIKAQVAEDGRRFREASVKIFGSEAAANVR